LLLEIHFTFMTHTAKSITKLAGMTQDAPPAKLDIVAYERQFDDEGRCQFSGPPMVGGDPPNIPGETIWYRCKACKDWFPIPPGYTVEVEEGDDDNDPFRP
jgi:hypothetical protein